MLWASTRRLVGDAEDTAQRELRAYISVGSHGIKPFTNYNLSRSTETIIRIGVRNVGQVPARNVRWFFGVEISENGRRKDFPIKDEFYGENLVIQPGTEMVRSQRMKFTKGDIQHVVTDEWHLYVWGKICYTDGFDNPRFTLFCHRYDRDGIGVGDINVTTVPFITGESMRYHQYGNDAD